MSGTRAASTLERSRLTPDTPGGTHPGRSEDLFVTLLEPTRDALWRFAHRACWDRSSAEDCVQDAVMTAFRKFDAFTPGTSFQAWMFRILSNVVLNSNHSGHRVAKRQAPIENLDLVAALETEEAYENVVADPDDLLDQVADPVRQAVRALPDSERAVFLLCAVEGFKYREIAEILAIPIGTVMSHLYRARVRLRQSLAEYARTSGFARSVPPSSPADRSESRTFP